MPEAKVTTASKILDLTAEIERLNGMVAALEKRLEQLEVATGGARKPVQPDTPEQGEIERRTDQTRRFVKQRERNLRTLDAALVAIRQAAREDSSAQHWVEEEVATEVRLEGTEISESGPRGTRSQPVGDAATGVPVPPQIAPPLSPADIPREMTEVSAAAPRALPPSAPIPVDDTADIKLIALRWSGGK
jgi:hypothetical protein